MDTRWTKAEGIAFVESEAAGELQLYVLAPTAEVPSLLEGTAIAIWDEISDKPQTALEISRKVAVQFGVETELIHGHVEAFLKEIRSQGLVVTS